MPRFDVNKMMSDPLAHMGLALMTTPNTGQAITQGLTSGQAAKKQFDKEQAKKVFARAYQSGATPDDILKIAVESEMDLADAAVIMKAIKSDLPSDVQSYEYYKKLPEAERESFLNIKRSPTVIDLGGAKRILGATAPGTGGGMDLPVTPKPQDMPGFQGRQAAATTAGKAQAEKEANRGKALNALSSFEQQANLVVDNVKRAKGKVSDWSTGYGSYLSMLPNTDAGELENYLNTIKANISFDKLQAMREASPTGGALGAVSDFETRLLQAVNGALDSKQRNQLEQNLTVIEDLYPKVLAEKKAAFQRDYGAQSGGGIGDDKPAAQPSNTTQPQRVRVIGPDGRQGTLDIQDLDDLISSGGRRLD